MTEDQVWFEIGRRIRLIRKWRGMNQLTLANYLRLTRVSISNTETGRQKMPVWNLLRMSQILRVPPHVWLLTPNDWAMWCEAEHVTAKRVTVTERPLVRTYKQFERVTEYEEAS